MKRIGITVAMLALTGVALGGDWSQWRGPELNGTCDARDLPVSWSVKSGKNIAWTCDLPGRGQSTPILTGQRLYLTTSDRDRLYAVGIDRATGDIAWKRELGIGRKALRGGTMAHPSAVSDGQRVYFLFGQGTLAATSLDGDVLWKRELEKDRGLLANKFGYSSSPLLHDGILYIPLLYRKDPEDESAKPGTTLLAVDTKTGKTLGEADRPTPATKESLDSYMTPILTQEGIVMTGADLFTCHDPKTGREIWRFDYAEGNRKTHGRLIAGPVAAGDLAVMPYSRGRILAAFKTGGEKAWIYEGYVPDVCTPAYRDGLLYVLDGKKRYLTCLDARKGKRVWMEKIPSNRGFFASPLVADGKVYLINLEGEIFVYSAGRQAKLLERFPMGGSECAASIIAVDNELFIRMPGNLYCVKK